MLLTFFTLKFSYWFVTFAIPFSFAEVILLEKIKDLSFKEEYAVSTKRIFIKTKNNLKTKDINKIGDITLEKTTDFIGSLTFKNVSLIDSVNLISTPNNFQCQEEFTFINIEDYVNIYALISNTRKTLNLI